MPVTDTSSHCSEDWAPSKEWTCPSCARKPTGRSNPRIFFNGASITSELIRLGLVTIGSIPQAWYRFVRLSRRASSVSWLMAFHTPLPTLQLHPCQTISSHPIASVTSTGSYNIGTLLEGSRLPQTLLPKARHFRVIPGSQTGVESGFFSCFSNEPLYKSKETQGPRDDHWPRTTGFFDDVPSQSPG